MYGSGCHLRPYHFATGIGRNGGAVNDDFARIEAIHTSQDLHQGALASPTLTHHSQNLTRPGVEAYIIKSYNIPVLQPVSLGQILNLEQN
jgi:hypothetical protein